MDQFLPGLIMGFREGLEAFLVVAVIIQFLSKTDAAPLKKNAYQGVFFGIVLSLLLGGLLYMVSQQIDKMSEMAKLWESGASLLALILVSTFIYWMIKNGKDMVNHVHSQVSSNLTGKGIFSVALVLVIREGAEIAIFTFAGKYTLLSILVGILGALLLTILIFKSLVKVNLKVLFSITLFYLILQSGFLLGYSIHEGLSAFKSLGMISADHWIFIKAFDLSSTIFYHKEGIIGLPLYVLFGWYSKPEIIQFVTQYLFTFSMLLFWRKSNSQKTIKS